MTAIVYPTSLPCPQTAPAQSDERRLLTSSGYFESRTVEHDIRATENIVFPPFSAAQAAEFWAWWRDMLLYGGARFAALWPTPRGVGPFVRQFLGTPSSRKVGNYEQISATVQIVGRGLAPSDGCFMEDFASLTPWVVVSGDGNLFTIISTPYGPGMDVAGQHSVTASERKRALDGRNRTSLTVTFRCTSLEDDDAIVLYLLSGATLVGYFNPRREVNYDSLHRAVVSVGSETLFATPGSVTLNDWYRLDLTISEAPGETVAVITHLADEVVVQTTTFTDGHTLAAVDAIAFYNDNGVQTSPTQFTLLELC